MYKVIPLIAVCFLFSFGFKGKKKIKTPENFVFIPSTTDKIGDFEYSVQAFFMLDHEVTNYEYRQFLSDLKANGKDSLYAMAYPDTTAWNTIGGFQDPMINLYFWHPAYDNYPVVNISAEGANEYCKWLTFELRDEHGEFLNDVRMPTKYEWIVAAKAGQQEAIYPWGSPYVRGTDGCYMANFSVIGEQNIRTSEGQPEIVKDSTTYPGVGLSLGMDNAFYTAPVTSFPKNDYGLYHMSGNVAELTADGVAMGGHWRSYGYDIRITSETKFEKANPYVGFRPVLTYIKK